ncbi:histidinol-phosphate transaminase [candidate division KSB1 bacterium]|nr:histidinol-phosphate transaminase [candidate division KSB1 bacterium]
MNKGLAAIRQSVREITPYSMTEKKYQIKINQNECPFDLPDNLKKEIQAKFLNRAWNRYPSFTTEQLRQKIAEKEQVHPDMILVGNGSNELIQIICSVILDSQSTFLIVQPTFQLYAQMGHIFGANLIQVDMNADFQYPINDLLKINQSNPIGLQIYCTPNNPTGSILTIDEMEAILAVAQGIVVIDEAYFDFHQVTALPLLEKYPHLIITRTFSKAFGLAGLRLGYLVAQPEIVQEVYKAKLPYNLNLFSELTAMALLENSNLVSERTRMILKERDQLMHALAQMNQVKVFPTHANFFLIRTPIQPDDLFHKLLIEEGILIRNVSHNHPLLSDKLRISVGTPEENRKVIAAFEKIFKK